MYELFLTHLHTESDVKHDLAVAIYTTYTKTKETKEDDTLLLAPSYTTFLDEELMEILLLLQKEEEQIQDLILHPSTSAQPIIVEEPMATPLASLTPLAVDEV